MLARPINPRVYVRMVGTRHESFGRAHLIRSKITEYLQPPPVKILPNLRLLRKKCPICKGQGVGNILSDLNVELNHMRKAIAKTEIADIKFLARVIP